MEEGVGCKRKRYPLVFKAQTTLEQPELPWTGNKNRYGGIPLA